MWTALVSGWREQCGCLGGWGLRGDEGSSTKHCCSIVSLRGTQLLCLQLSSG